MYRHEPLTARGARAGAATARSAPCARSSSGFTFALEPAPTTSGSIPRSAAARLWDVGCYPVTLRAADRRSRADDGVRLGALDAPAASTKSSRACCASPAASTATIYAGFRARVSHLARGARQRRRADACRIRSARVRSKTLELERGGEVERIDVQGSPLHLRPRGRGLRGARARRRAAGRDAGGKPPAPRPRSRRSTRRPRDTA